MRLIAWSALLALLPLAAGATDVTVFPAIVRQALELSIVGPEGSALTLEALAVRPVGPGPFPLVLVLHGTNRLIETFPNQRPETYISPALVFAQRGYAVVIVMRSGFGRSTGSYAEYIGTCDDYTRPSNIAAGEMLQALSAVQKERWVDGSRVVLLGHSTGGLAALAISAMNPPGILGVISFASGNGSARPDYVCQPDRLVEADRIFGETARVPSLWIHSANDHFFGPDLTAAMFAAYTAKGAPALLFEAPPWRGEGHSFIWAPEGTAWWPEVKAFLMSLHLPTEIVVPLSLPNNMAPPAFLDDAGHAAFERYLQSRSYEKAFAVATNAPGHWGWVFSERTKTDAARAALKDCQKLDRVCQVYAIGNDKAAPVGLPN